MAEQKIPSNIAGVIDARRSASLGWRRCLCELVDNSIDAEARTIRIELSKSEGLSIIDDGHGIEDVLVALTDGETTKKGRNKIGRWGVGLKDAAMWAAGNIDVKSVRNGIQRVGNMDFTACAERGEFFGNFEETPAPQALPGTAIFLSPLVRDRKLPGKADIEQIAKDLSFTYHPFISENSTIRLFLARTEIQLAPFRRPKLEHVEEFAGNVGGKRYSVEAGVLAEGEPAIERNGFHLIFGKRVIVDARTDRASGQYAIGRFYGEIRLGEGWILERNKDNVFESRLLDNLYDVVLERCEPILKIADSQGIDIHTRQVESELNRWVAETTGQDPMGILGEEKRPGEHKQVGTVEPKETDRTRKEAENVIPMPGKDVKKRRGNSRKSRGYIVKFDDFQEKIIGNTKESNPVVILLNKRHPWISKHRNNLDTLKVITSVLIAMQHVRADLWQDGFSAKLSDLLAEHSTTVTSQIFEGVA